MADLKVVFLKARIYEIIKEEKLGACSLDSEEDLERVVEALARRLSEQRHPSSPAAKQPPRPTS